MRSVLEARVLQLWMRQTLREMHKSPYLREGEWERMLAAYEACFPGQRGPAPKPRPRLRALAGRRARC